MLNKTLLLFVPYLFTSGFAGVRFNTNYKSSDQYPQPQGTEPIYLQGGFSGVVINRETEERKFVFNKDNNCYELFIELNEGDYFYPFDSLKRKPFYWSKEIVPPGESSFEANGLSWYSFSNDDGYWYVNQTGTYHIAITYLIENYVNAWREIWNETYNSYIEFVCNNNKNQYCLFDKKENQSFSAYTEKQDSKIHQYGYNGGHVYNTRNVSIPGFENKTIVNIPYDFNYSEKFSITEVVDNQKDSSELLNLSENLFLNGSLESSESSTKRICSIVSKVENAFCAGHVENGYLKSNITQSDSKMIISEYESLTDEERNVVDNTTMTYQNNSENVTEKIANLIPLFKSKAKKVFRVSAWSYIIPIVGFFAILSLFIVFLNFKKKES